MKKIYFLSGFPRAGNTILSTILNQNKDIAVSGHSMLPDCFFNLEILKNKSTYHNFKNEESFENVKKNLVNNFYQHWKQKYIIDRAEWGTPFNYQIMEKYCPNEFKIIFLLRKPTDVIKSFLKLCNDFPNFYINSQYNNLDKSTLFKSEQEEKIDIITGKDTFFDWSCYTYKNLIDKENVLFIKYEDLTESPENCLNLIYEFLNIPKFNHTFEIDKLFEINNIKYDDSFFGAPLHKIRLGKITKNNYAEIKIPKYVEEKYKNLIKEYL